MTTKTTYKTDELTGLLLDWATLDAGAAGLAVDYTPDPLNNINGLTPTFAVWEPTVNRAQAMLLMEDARLSVSPAPKGRAVATAGNGANCEAEDYCSAICRTYVLLRRGDTVEIPDEIARFADHCAELRNEI